VNYEQLLIVVSIGSVFAGGAIGAIALMSLRTMLLRAIARRRGRVRARLLLASRLVPLATGSIAALGLGIAFLRYEPHNTSEEPGVLLWLTAGTTLVLMLMAVRRVAASAWQTRQRHRLLNRCGVRIVVPRFPIPVWRVHTDFPVAAVSGVFRPRLILSSRVLDECSPEELVVVLRHERAHVRGRHNLLRGCLLGLPDVLSLTPDAGGLARAWYDAVEEAADDDAVGNDTEARLTLADALVRVARMATAPPPPWMPALALFDGDNLDARVRRLVEPESPALARPTRQRVVGVAIGALLAATAVWAASGPRPLHDLIEWAVRNLP
jgi:beta-lactamase regulating signal transducer with metallopeptidase domain